MQNPSFIAWGKFRAELGRHPLDDHCLDVAATFRQLCDLPLIARLGALTASQRDRLAVIAFLHDFGKCNRGFQAKIDPAVRDTAGHVLEAVALLFDLQDLWPPGWTALLTDIAGWFGDEEQALQVLLRDSWLFLETYVSGEARLLFSPGASEFFRLTGRQGDGLMGGAQRRWTGWQWLTAACFEGYLLLLYGLAGKVWWRHCVYRGSLWLLGGVALYFFVVSGGGQAVSRLRLPAMAIVCVLAGGGTDKRSERSCGDPGRI